MSDYTLGVLTGTPAGVVVAVLVGVLVTTRRKRIDKVPALSEDDRNVICAEFVEHSEATQQQMSQFADELAGDDVVLRERLRRFEQGGVK